MPTPKTQSPKNRKCPLCNNFIEGTSDRIQYKDKWVHKACFDLTMKLLATSKSKELAEKEVNSKSKKRTTKPTTEIVDAVSEEEYKQKQQFFTYMKQILGVDKLTPKFYTLADKYSKQYGINYQQMYQTFYYWFDLKHSDVVGDCIGLLPYIYDEAKTYWNAVALIEQHNSNVQVKSMYKEKTIRINPNRKRAVPQLEIENIIDTNCDQVVTERTQQS